MSDHTEHSIVVAADPGTIMDVIADFPNYPLWVDAAREVTVIAAAPDGAAEQVRFVLDAGVLRDTYILEYAWDPDRRWVRWNLVESELQRAQHGEYALTALAQGSTKVTYTLTVDLNIPVIGRLKRRAERAITDTALTELKKRVEG